jgi:hypothetical protein
MITYHSLKRDRLQSLVPTGSCHQALLLLLGLPIRLGLTDRRLAGTSMSDMASIRFLFGGLDDELAFVLLALLSSESCSPRSLTDGFVPLPSAEASDVLGLQIGLIFVVEGSVGRLVAMIEGVSRGEHRLVRVLRAGDEEHVDERGRVEWRM